MFIATRQLKVVDKQNRVTIFKPGDPVIGFENWSYSVQKAHINLEWVRREKDDFVAGPSEKPRPAAKLPTKKKAPAPKKPKPEPVSKPKPEPEKEVLPAEEFKCSLCPKSAATLRALKIHAKMAHGKIAK